MRKPRAKIFEQRKKAMQLAIAGVDYQTVAEQCGYATKQAAWKAVKDMMRQNVQPVAEQYRWMQVIRLDKMLAAIWSSVLNGNLQAIDRALKLEERRSQLLGLDAPVKIAPTEPDGENPYVGATHAERAVIIAALLDRARTRQIGSSLEGRIVGGEPGDGGEEADRVQ